MIYKELRENRSRLAGQRHKIVCKNDLSFNYFGVLYPYHFGVIFHFYTFLRYAPKNAKAENIENILH